MPELSPKIWDKVFVFLPCRRSCLYSTNPKEIISYLQWRLVEPYPPYDRETYGGRDSFAFRRHSWYIPQFLNVKELNILRLVSKTVNGAATRALLVGHIFELKLDMPKLRDILLVGSTSSPTSPARPALFAYKYRHLRVNLDYPNIRHALDKEFMEARNEAIIKNFDLLIEQLPTFVANCKDLISFEFRFFTWSNQFTVGGASHNNPDPGPAWDIEKLTAVRESLCKALLAADFSNLKAIRFNMPTAYDFVQLSEVVDKIALPKVHHLHVGVLVGNDWIAEYNTSSKDLVPKAGEQQKYQPSNLEVAHPHKQFEFALFDIANRFTRNQGLVIDSQTFLDTDYLHWEAAGDGLHRLHLNRVRIPATKLIKFLSSKDGTKSIIWMLFLNQVELTAGTWNDVFQHLIKLGTRLSYFSPWMLSYAEEGESKQFRDRTLGYGAYKTSLFSSSLDDHQSLRTLAELVDQRGEGQSEFVRTGKCLKKLILERS